MHTTRPFGLGALVLLTGLVVAACVATTAPIEGSATASVSSPRIVPSGSARPVTTPAFVVTVPPTEAPTAASQAAPAPEPSEDQVGTAGPGCGTGQAGLFAHNDEVPKTLQFGGATLEFVSVSVSMRNGTYDTSDSVPGGIGLTPDEIAVVVGPGDRIVLRAAGTTLHATQARVVPWRSVHFEGGLASLGGDPIELAWRPRGDGSLSVAAPDANGDYAVEFFPRWTGTCIEGDGIAYSRIKVR